MIRIVINDEEDNTTRSMCNNGAEEWVQPFYDTMVWNSEYGQMQWNSMFETIEPMVQITSIVQTIREIWWLDGFRWLNPWNDKVIETWVDHWSWWEYMTEWRMVHNIRLINYRILICYLVAGAPKCWRNLSGSLILMGVCGCFSCRSDKAMVWSTIYDL